MRKTMSAEPLTRSVEPDDMPMADAEAQARAQAYGLLASLLRRIPSEQVLTGLRQSAAADTSDDFSRALLALQLAAARVSRVEIDDEFHQLFVGLGRGELVPYGSWYLTGFLMEKPLGELRRDLALLGFDRQEGVAEPEDHVAALFEVMSMLILDGVPVETQRAFFDKHIGCWVSRFFADLAAAETAVFYRAVGHLGAAFADLEHRYLALET